MQLVVDIKNESLADKIVKLLEIFKSDGIEMKILNSKSKNEGLELADEYIEEYWRELVMTNHSDPNYYKSEQYKIDRAIDLEKRGKI